MKEITTNTVSDDNDLEMGLIEQLSDDGDYSPTSVHGSSEPNGLDDADELMTSDCGDPPLGIIDDGSSSDFWRSAPQSVVNGELKEPRTGANNTNHAAHDGEKEASVAKHVGDPIQRRLNFNTTPAVGNAPTLKTKPVVCFLLSIHCLLLRCISSEGTYAVRSAFFVKFQTR